MITECIKFSVGFNRPDYFAREGKAEKVFRDGMLSLPSGHASFSFCTMTFCFLYLAGQLRLYSNFNKKYIIPTFIACFSPFAISAFIALSRVVDFHHHPADVIIGSLIGTVVSTLTYFLYFPRLNSKDCHVPFNRSD